MAIRERLPVLRDGRTLHFTIYAEQQLCPCCEAVIGGGEVKGHLTANEYEDGRLGEVFLRIGLAGSSDSLYDQWAIDFSIALQLGADVNTLCQKHIGTHHPISGPTNVPGIRICTSVLDLVCRWLKFRYGSIDVAEGAPRRDVTEIIEVVAEHYGVEAKLIKEHMGRSTKLALPRQVAMYLARQVTGASFPRLGRVFKRDHTTLIYACQKVEEMITVDAVVKAEVEAIMVKLKQKGCRSS